MGLGTSSRRDLGVIICCSLILIFLIEFRYNVSTKVLVRVDQSGSTSTTRTASSPSLNEFELLDEYGDAVRPVPPTPPKKKHPTGKGAHRGHGKNIAAKVAANSKASKYNTHDRTVDDSKILWAKQQDMPLTSLIRHSPGWTIMDNVYFLNGTLYVVRADSHPAAFPDVRMMISNHNSNTRAEKREPTEANMKIISAASAEKLFGNKASRVEGTSFISYDDVDLFSHYYHFSAEVLFGLWRTYSSLDLAISPAGHTKLSQPRRFLAPHVPVSRWRDYANLNQYVFRAAFPSTGIEFQSDWNDRAETMRPYLFDRIVLGDRLAASRGSDPANIDKGIYHADKMPKSPHWWAPVRNNVVAFSGGDSKAITKPVITYVTRQAWGKRMMRDGDHRKLVKALKGLERKYSWEVNVVNLEELSRDEQIRLAGRTTILMGVHGAGLTSLVWMRPTERSTVIEFLAPQSFSSDFEYTARMLDIKHYSVWNNRHMTYPELPNKSDLPARGISPDFDSNEIPVDADEVVKLVVERLVSTLS